MSCPASYRPEKASLTPFLLALAVDRRIRRRARPRCAPLLVHRNPRLGCVELPLSAFALLGGLRRSELTLRLSSSSHTVATTVLFGWGYLAEIINRFGRDILRMKHRIVRRPPLPPPPPPPSPQPRLLASKLTPSPSLRAASRKSPLRQQGEGAVSRLSSWSAAPARPRMGLQVERNAVRVILRSLLSLSRSHVACAPVAARAHCCCTASRVALGKGTRRARGSA